jgi:DEAD/DEAH box helicase domain-containing protein
VRVVDSDTAPRAERDIVLWNPELLDPELGHPCEPARDASRLLAEAGRPRPAHDLLHEEPQDRGARPPLRERPPRHRDGATAGPLPRGVHTGAARDIERRLVDGELLGVTATDALELGIDVGSLDCAISVGFPGTVASLRQQWGRAGRATAGSRC